MGTPRFRTQEHQSGRGAHQDDCGTSRIEARGKSSNQGYGSSEETERDCRELARLLIELCLRNHKRQCAEDKAGASASPPCHAATGSATVEASRAVSE